MSATAQDEASARSQRFLTAYGKQAAQRVWDRTLRYGYAPDEIPDLIGDECEILGLLMDDERIGEPDRTKIIDFVRLVIVREGKQLAILFATDTEGTA